MKATLNYLVQVLTLLVIVYLVFFIHQGTYDMAQWTAEIRRAASLVAGIGSGVILFFRFIAIFL